MSVYLFVCTRGFTAALLGGRGSAHMAVRYDFIDPLSFTFSSFFVSVSTFCFSFMDHLQVAFLSLADQ